MYASPHGYNGRNIDIEGRLLNPKKNIRRTCGWPDDAASSVRTSTARECGSKLSKRTLNQKCVCSWCTLQSQRHHDRYIHIGCRRHERYSGNAYVARLRQCQLFFGKAAPFIQYLRRYARFYMQHGRLQHDEEKCHRLRIRHYVVGGWPWLPVLSVAITKYIFNELNRVARAPHIDKYLTDALGGHHAHRWCPGDVLPAVRPCGIAMWKNKLGRLLIRTICRYLRKVLLTDSCYIAAQVAKRPAISFPLAIGMSQVKKTQSWKQSLKWKSGFLFWHMNETCDTRTKRNAAQNRSHICNAAKCSKVR